MNDVWQTANGIYSLQDAAVLFGLCLGVILVMRGFGAAKGKIALVVIIVAAIFSPIIQPDPPKELRARIAWDAKKGAIGVGLGFLALYFYKSALKKIEEKLGIKGGDDDEDDSEQKPKV